MHTADSQFVSDIIQIIRDGKDKAYAAVNASMIDTYWNVGRLFYLQFPDYEIWHARVPNLTWTHFR